MKNKVKIGVLMGGRSIEREVSFNSGRTICDHIDTAMYEAIPIFQTNTGDLFILPGRFLHRGKISDFEHKLATDAQKIEWNDLKLLVDLVYPAQHGRYGEDGILQGALELLGIPYIGSKILTSAIGMDKYTQKRILAAAGIIVPRDLHVRKQESATLTVEQIIERLKSVGINMPCIVKPRREGSSCGVSAVAREQELLPAIKQASLTNSDQYDDVLIEERITGMEFTCIVLFDPYTQQPMPLPVTEIVPEQNTIFDYEQKYMPGRATKFTPARCAAEQQEAIQRACVRVAQLLGMKTLARIDGFLTDDGQIIIIDPNTLSGMSPSSFIFRQAAELGMGHTQVISHIIETELGQHELFKSVERMQERKSMAEGRRMRVGVIFGGRSNEREISLESGRNVIYKLSPHEYEVMPIFLSSTLELYHIPHKVLVRNTTHEIESDLSECTKITWDALSTLIDFAFLGLHGGEGENGAIQGMLEMLKIPYNGSGVLTSALCMDKYRTNTYLKQLGFSVPAHLLIGKDEWLASMDSVQEECAKKLSFPLIVKPHDDGCSVFVQKVHNPAELVIALEQIFAHGKQYAFIEEYVTGMELTVGVLGNDEITVLPPSQAVTKAGVLSIEEKFLPGAGENQTPAPLPAAALAYTQDVIGCVYKALEVQGYARIDCFYQSAKNSPTGEQRVVILEINTLPALTPATCLFHQGAEIGLRPMDVMHRIIQLGLERFNGSTVQQFANLTIRPAAEQVAL